MTNTGKIPANVGYNMSNQLPTDEAKKLAQELIISPAITKGHKQFNRLVNAFCSENNVQALRNLKFLKIINENN